MAAEVDRMIRHAGKVSLFFCLTRQLQPLELKCNFLLVFLLKGLTSSLKNISKTTRGNSPYEYAAFTIVERYAKFTAHIILI